MGVWGFLCVGLASLLLHTSDAQGQTGDVVMVVDGSSRVSVQQWRELRAWLQHLTSHWTVGPHAMQVGLYVYGSGVHQMLSLQQGSSGSLLQQHIQTLPRYGGSADAGSALRQALQEGFLPHNGARPRVPHVIIHVTAGPAADVSLLQQEVDAAKQQGVAVYRVGVGAGSILAGADLAQEVSEPVQRYGLSADNYRALLSLSDVLTSRVTHETGSGSASVLPGAYGSVQRADIVFVMDGSSSVGPDNFQRQLSALKTFTSQLPVSRDGVHVGLVQFASFPSVAFGLDLHTHRSSLLKALDGVHYQRGGTNTADALHLTATQLFSQTMGARTHVPRIAVLLTDGASASMENTIKEANLARQNHIGVVALGIGDQVNMAELQAVAGSAADVIHVEDYGHLPSAMTSLLQRISRVSATVAPISSTLNSAIIDPCKDNLTNCALYDESVCTQYEKWARGNCNKHCGFCTPLLPDVLPACADKKTNCGNYDTTMCTDSRYAAWVTENCALFCGLCGTDTASNGYYGQCYYKGKTYSTGQSWYDGCDYLCTCVEGRTGQYTCYNRCPVYTDLPSSCTLVKSEDSCCLRPVCNFQPTVQTSITTGLGHTAQGLSVCEHEGHQYIQGESWDVGCDLKCVCEEAVSGKIRCQSYCPSYGVLPSYCHLQKQPGQCCSQPVCEFSTQIASTSGFGQISGQGAVTQPTSAPACVDKLTNCAQYPASSCHQPYRQWALVNCRAFCGLCTSGEPVPTANDTCLSGGKRHGQGETWDIGCDQRCVCEQAVYGYYRCVSRCPDYSNLPAQCTRTPASGDSCCDVIRCPSSVSLLPSTLNVLTTGSGGEIAQPDPGNPGHYVSLVGALTASGGNSGAVQTRPQHTIQGCLYKGQLYIQGQRWDDGCQQVCECTKASQGLYTCSSRCPQYRSLPAGCTLRTDPADACCKTAVCPPHVLQLPVPEFPGGSVSQGLVRPPSWEHLLPTSQTVLVTQTFPHGNNSPPTMPTGPTPSGGIGYCEYKGQRYGQSAMWTDGCDYNCLCQDASTGYWVCADMCLTYPAMPQFCRLVVDKQYPCCRVPHCEIPGYTNSTFGLGSTLAPIITTQPPIIVTATSLPRPAQCVYKGEQYSQGQEWYDGCDYRCQCYDAIQNLYSCTDRCPTFYGLDESRCTLQPDPRDPVCCRVPVCQAPSTHIPGQSTPVPTAPGGSFVVTSSAGIGYCDYKGRHYHQGDSWTDGCQFTCHCLDDHEGRYRCDERCPRFPNLPSACRLVRDFSNPCCQKPQCNFTPWGGSISGHLITAAPVTTSRPGQKLGRCVYHGVQYSEGQTWEDGCQWRCRCEDGDRGLYVCDNRCAQYPQLPAQCQLVTDPRDQCCRVPQCAFIPTSANLTGHGATPSPFPTLSPGQITGQVNLPTPGPGQKPTPVGYCVYKGVQYREGQTWQDGCDYDCLCQDASIGKYVCHQKCAQFPSLPAQCRLLKDPARPCCRVPDCSFPPFSSIHTGHASTPAPSLGPHGSTLSPPTLTTRQPSGLVPTPCVYGDRVYQEGQTWYDGCDYVCVCEEGRQGAYRCEDRCPSYPRPADSQCVMTPDPRDPMCCALPHCQGPTPTPVVSGGPYLVPTLAPKGEVTGGSVTPSPTPRPGADGSTLSPHLAATTPTPPAVCIYKGEQYGQGEKWQDGCDYYCQCEDAATGHYRCVEICPTYPVLSQGCYTVRDPAEPCCLVPLCPALPTLSPPTLPSGHTLSPHHLPTTPVPERCVYNGVQFSTGDTWTDGCDLKCRCEDQAHNIYRCDQRCPRYQSSPGCTMVTDPRDPCCLAPVCRPTPLSTSAPDPSHHSTLAPHQVPVPTSVPGQVIGNTVDKQGNNSLCVYNGVRYRQGERWTDGCKYNCECTDQVSGRYVCTERCSHYIDTDVINIGCRLVPDPQDLCCVIPLCSSLPDHPATPLPSLHTTQAPQPGHTVPTPGPGQPSTPGPQQPGRCQARGVQYLQGQQWYLGCEQVCVCEDASTGHYRCSDRCKRYEPVPKGCTLVADPSDPSCCKVPQCVPTPGTEGYITPPPGQTPTPFTVTYIPGVVTGRLPTPTPDTSGHTPQPVYACVYKGHKYARGQRWQDGCDYRCVCENDVTGEYKCTERCNTYPMVPAMCRLSRDPSDLCCQVMTCDPGRSTPNPYLTLSPRPSRTPAPATTHTPTRGPDQLATPRPVPTLTTPAPHPHQSSTLRPQHLTPSPYQPRPVCVYYGATYTEGDSWQVGCSKTCRCQNADSNDITCFDRCPTYDNIDPKCTLTLDPNDPCCQVPVCPVIPTSVPTLTPGHTPHGGRPTSVPTPTPFALPHKVPTGSVTGSRPVNPNHNPKTTEDMCVYKGVSYKQGQKWDDGCDYTCTCIDSSSGRYICQQRCDQYRDLPSYCVLTTDPRDQCCLLPLCTSPVTPRPSHPLTPRPQGSHTTPHPPLAGASTIAPRPGGTTETPTFITPLPSPTPSSQGSVCVMGGRTYTGGQRWYVGCSQQCVCQLWGSTAFHTCTQRCPAYAGTDPTCPLVPSPSDPACCLIPQCPDPGNPHLPQGHKGTITGTAQPPTPTPYPTPRPGQTGVSNTATSTPTPQPKAVCLYKGQEYVTGRRWRDGCDYDCVCQDGTTGLYRCTDRCNKYPPLLAGGCRMERDPNDPCCQVPVCSLTASPTLFPPTGPTVPTKAPPVTAVCMYQGVPHRQGQTWTVGCDKACRCEDAQTGLVNCHDRCARYPGMTVGCGMVTDPRDPCCQMPQCQPPLPQGNTTTQIITGIPGVIQGSGVIPGTSHIHGGNNPRGCVYHGTRYQQGQQWADGCSYTCVCDDASTGRYTCTDRCARVPHAPATCSLVPDPRDQCCQVLRCPALTTPTPHTPTPNPQGGPSTQTPPPGHTVSPRPLVTPTAGMCVYKKQHYREQQVWYDGCEAQCTCEDGATGFYRCQPRCGLYQNVPASCVMVPDPRDPLCCQMPQCSSPTLTPGGSTPTGPVILRPTLPTAVFTNFPTPSPSQAVRPTPHDGHTAVPPGASTQAPRPRTGCVYKGKTYHQNEQWKDGCDFTCVCLNEDSGRYQCSERCGRLPSVPRPCVLIQDPQDACCQVPYCDFRPTPFPHGLHTPTPAPGQITQGGTSTPRYVIPGYVTVQSGGHKVTPRPRPGTDFGGASQVCVYKGVVYRAGQQWSEGCDRTCVCDDAVHGLYTCRDRCPSYSSLGSGCRLRVNPSDTCCLVPDCNPNYITPLPGTGITGSRPNVNPGQGTGTSGGKVTPQPGSEFTGSNPDLHPNQGTGINGTRAPILVPTAAPATFTGHRPQIAGNLPGMVYGYSDKCVYKGVTYSQGQQWEDGCQYRCQCTDAIRGTYRCTERCSSLYFLPAQCQMIPDPQDACCQRAMCSPDAFPPTPLPHTTTHPQATTVQTGTVIVTAQPPEVFHATLTPIGSTLTSFTGKPADQCVYTDGRSYRQGQSWMDGCAYTCVCQNAATNVYVCSSGCPAYSSLPGFCSLVQDSPSSCCQTARCVSPQGRPLRPLPGTHTPTPSLGPGVTDVLPLGTHQVLVGSGLLPGQTRPGFFGGKKVCVYKGTVHNPGDTWDDGCDYTCQCLTQPPSVYRCYSKCPTLPALPHYCRLTSVPGQCCPSLSCHIPDAGTYRPLPHLTPGLIPTPTAFPNGSLPHTANPQVIVPSMPGNVLGGLNPPGGGALLPSTVSMGGITDRCVYQGTDGRYRVYTEGEAWTVNTCDYTCTCVDARSGFYRCSPVCADYSQGRLPAKCSLQQVQGECCPHVLCTNPDGTVVDYLKNPTLTFLPVYGIKPSGYTGFRPGYLASGSVGFSGQSNVCIYQGTAHGQGSQWDDGCDFTCQCADARTGLYSCTQKCPEYTTLPAVCRLVRQGSDCCLRVSCTPAPTQTTTTLSTTTVAPAVSTNACGQSDKLSTCHLYNKTQACGVAYEDWARENCAVFCGYAVCAIDKPTTPAPCVDKRTDCAAFGPQACTGQYEAWATDNCRKSCNLCPCVDKASNCQQYGQYMCVGSYKTWAHEHCAKTCNLCDHSPQQYQTTQPPNPSCAVPSGQTLLMKAVAGAPGDVWHLWTSPNSAYVNMTGALTLDSHVVSNFKSPLANNMDMCDFDTIKVSIYKDCVERASLTFRGQQSGQSDWFTGQRLIASSFLDLTPATVGSARFQMTGDPTSGREFFVGGAGSGCDGSAWFFVSTRSACPFESQGPKPAYYFASGHMKQPMQPGYLQSGDVLAIFGQGGTCSQGATTPHSFTDRSQSCVYKGQAYSQGQWWADGCQYNCTCVNAVNGFYQCFDLCLTYTNLPDDCPLVKQPRECCAKPSCYTNLQSGCVYKGKLYQQGQTWTDGCDYRCTCEDGTDGRYKCTSRCLQFQLPAVCHMDPPPANKCCSIPVCPSNIKIQYPDGYVPE